MIRRTQDAAMLLLRLSVGGVLFGWFGGHGIEGTAGAFEWTGFKPGRASAVAAGLDEACGGAPVMLGPCHGAGSTAARRRSRGAGGSGGPGGGGQSGNAGGGNRSGLAAR